MILPRPHSLHDPVRSMLMIIVSNRMSFHATCGRAPRCVPESQAATESHLNWKRAKVQPCSYENNTRRHSPWLRTEDAYPPLFFRKLPGSRNVYAQMHNEKEQEMTSPVNHSEDTQHIIQGEEFIDDDMDSQTLGNAGASPAFRSLIRTTTNHCY